MEGASLPGKSRAPWTTVRCSILSIWVWTGATHGSPKLKGLCSTPGKSRAPRTTVRCSMSSLWAWTGATHPPFAETYRSLQHPGKVPPPLDDSALFDEFDMGLDGCNPRFAETHRSLLHPGKSRHRTRSLPTALRAGHCEARKAGIVGERLDGVPGNHPSPETVFRHCPLPNAGEGNDAGCSTTRVRRRGGRAGRRG